MSTVFNLIVSIAALVAAIGSAIAARRSAISAHAIQLKEEAAYGLSLLSTEPLLDMEVDSVEYKWVRGGESVDATRLPLNEIRSQGICGEIMVGGMVRAGQSEVLLSAKQHPNANRAVWYPLQNEGVFRLLRDGERREVSQAVIPADSALRFEWVDRRPIEEWLSIESLIQRGFPSRKELGLPPLETASGIWDQLKYCLKPPRERIKVESQIARSGFTVVAETRASRRLPVVWLATVTATPFQLRDRDEKNGWIVDCPTPFRGIVDDDVLVYRYHFDYSLAQLEPPRWIMLPGRQ